MAKTSNHYILILCGGTGPRLWPLSHANFPKQFLKIFGSQSLLQETISRFKKFIPVDNIFVISNRNYLTELKKQIGVSIPKKNIIVEPEKKNTTMAIIYGAAVIKNKNPDAIITSAPSDHFISLLKNFQKDITTTYQIASTADTIVTIGIKPTYSNPSFGYILPSGITKKLYPVQKFIEKPSVINAQILIKKNAYWNSGIYTFSINTLTTELARLQKDYYLLFKKLEDSLNKPLSITKLYKLAKNIPFDVTISENSNKLSMISSSFQWSDVGEWRSIFNHLIKDKAGMAKINKNSIYVTINSKNCLISEKSNKLVGLVSVNNLAIIDTPDSLLVCNLNDSFSVRDLVSLIIANPKLKKYFLTSNVRQ